MENHHYELLRSEITGLRDILTEQIRGIRADYKRIEDANDELRQNMERQYVTQADFKPVRAIVYGMVGVMLMALLAAILSKVVQK